MIVAIQKDLPLGSVRVEATPAPGASSPLSFQLISSGRSRRCLISSLLMMGRPMKARLATVQSVVSVLALGLAVLGAHSPTEMR